MYYVVGFDNLLVDHAKNQEQGNYPRITLRILSIGSNGGRIQS